MTFIVSCAVISNHNNGVGKVLVIYPPYRFSITCHICCPEIGICIYLTSSISSSILFLSLTNLEPRCGAFRQSDTCHQPNSQGRCELALPQPLVPGEGGLNVIVHVLQIIVKLRVDNDMNSLIVLRSHWRHLFVIVALLIFNIWRESRGCQNLFTALNKCFWDHLYLSFHPVLISNKYLYPHNLEVVRFM